MPFDFSLFFCFVFVAMVYFLCFSLFVVSLYMMHRSSLIIRNQKRKADVEEAIGYFDVMASYLDDLRKIQRKVRQTIR